MLGNDFDAFEEFKAKYIDPEGKVLRFLDNTPIPGEKTAYMTIARSGNTFLRKYIETITGISTGSDMPVQTPMPLQMTGMIGEGIVDDRCWVTKTHFPSGIQLQSFKAHKVIICVRNPFDVIKSISSFFTTFTHSKSQATDLPEDHPKFF